ncbi:recombinase family protein [Brevundimonas sp. UBA5936]|uniref:recombinase family protein n=1 Tax=Brevundimonas sp. UBA5936 TaxID=1946133 RepID=UPI0025C5973C|nr:recombinase family protein [Brevundimonas sp. UBA5936]
MYARVSSKEQDREGFSIPAQTKLMKDYADANDIQVAREFVDVETAKKSGRTSFNEMLQYIRRHPTVRMLLVEKTDRLYRNLKDWVTVDDLDIEIHFVKEGVVLSQDSRSSEKFMHGIKVLMAKNYIDNLSEETRKGMLEKAEQGLWPTVAPIGYLNVEGPNGKKIITIDPALGPLVQRLYEWYSTGQYSLKDVSKKARLAGLTYRKSGAPIGVSTVHTILRNRIYTGAFEWLGKVYQGSHAPLISEDLWSAVQDVLDGRKAANIRASANDFPFTGMMTCGHCGCAMVGEIKKQRYIYYHCTGFKGKCGEPYVREEVLEQRFAGLLRQLRFDDAAFELIQRALRESLQDETRERRAAIERLRGEADRLQARIERMYEDKLDGVVTDDFYRRMQIVWREERDRCLKDIERHHSADDEYIGNGIALIRLGREAHDLFEQASASEKRRVLNLVLSNCSWAHGELTAKFRQPFDLLSETIAQSTLPKKGEAGDLPENEKWLRG